MLSNARLADTGRDSAHGNCSSSHDSSAEEGAMPSPPEKHPERIVKGFRWFCVCVGMFSANLLYGLDTTIAGDIQLSVSETFNNISQLGWLGVGFGLGSTVSILPIGKAYAVFNTKWLYVTCLAMFAAGSALCGGAPSMNAMIVGRVWAGAGGAGMYLGTLNLIASISKPDEQAFYISFQGFVYGLGCILGPIVGGLLADSAATWRWAFYLNLVLFGVSIPIYIFSIPSVPRRPELALSEKLMRFDWLGIILTAGLYVSFVIAFTFGGIIWPWSDGRFIASLVVFIILTIAFAITQHHAFLTTTLDRLFPCEFLRHPQLVLLYISMAAGASTFAVGVYYIPLFFFFIHGDSGTQVAVRLLPLVAFYVTGLLVCGSSMPRLGYHWAWYLFSGLCLTTGGGAMYSISSDTPSSHIYGYSVLLGLGLTVSQAGYAIGGQLVDSDKAADIIQFLNIAQGQSLLLGLVLADSIFQNKAFEGMNRVLQGQRFSRLEIQAAIAGSRSNVFRIISPELKEETIGVLVESIGFEWILIVVGGAVLTFCAALLNKARFPQKLIFT